MVEVVENRVESLKTHLLKSSSHFGGAKFFRLINEFAEEEKLELFGDKRVLNKIYKLENYDAITAVFRLAPASIQDLMWENNSTQKILLGMEKISDEYLFELKKRKKFFLANEPDRKKYVGKFYYGPNKLRALQVLLRYVKSDKIFDQLSYNKYFHMILLWCDKVPDSFYGVIDVKKTFEQLVKSDVYKICDKYSKQSFVQQANNNYSQILIPPDTNLLYGESQFKTRVSFHYDREKTLATMLGNKLFALAKKNMKLDISAKELKKLCLAEINVLKSDEGNVVDQELVNKVLDDVIEDAFADGTIFSEKYLNLSSLEYKVQCTMFKMIVNKSIGNPQYEEKLLNYLYSLLFNNEYNELEKKALMISLKNSLIYADEDTLKYLFINTSDLKSMFFLRFNLTSRYMNYLEGISVQQLMRINVKHINRIVEMLYDADNDELSDSYSKAIKLYLIFGLERTVELLNGTYPVNKRFLDNVSRLNVTKTEMKIEGKKYLPVVHEEFTRFMFNPYNIDAIFDEETAISATWYYLYNNFDSIKNLCKGHITLGQAETILKEQVNTVRYDLDPDCYRLENILYEAGLGNKTHGSNEVVYDEMSRIHKEQIKRITSTIPYVKGKLDNGWSYEVMRYDAVVAYVLGYRANCCIRVKDLAHNHLLHALLSPNGRILLTYKPDGTIASFSPLKRNGELLIANSIERIEKAEGASGAVVTTFLAGMKEICRVSKENEKGNYLKVATIGAGAFSKPIGEPWPSKIPTPTILEKDDVVYKDTDIYHRKLNVVYKEGNVNLGTLKYGKIEHKYYDPRKEILASLYRRDEVILQRKIIRIIDSIRYRKWQEEGNSEKKFEKTRLSYFKALFCNEDWYIIVDCGNRVHYECIEDDPRALKEMNVVLSTLEEYLQKDNVESYVLTLTEKKTK